MAIQRQITPDEFMNTVFPQENLMHWEVPLIAHPAEYTDKVTGAKRSFYRQYAWNPRSTLLNQPRGWTFCISTVVAREKIRRRLQDLRNTFVIVCGTKASPPPVDPSYILETSPDNFQYGYLIDPLYVGEGGTGAQWVDGLLLALAKRGWNDAGCRGAARVVKVPGAVHKSGFITRVTRWAPHDVWDADELRRAFGIEAHEMNVRRTRARLRTELARGDIKDPVLDWLIAKGLVVQVNDRGFAELAECPWAHEHSKTADGAGYSPLDYGQVGRSFRCLHESCAHRTFRDFMDRLEFLYPDDDTLYRLVRRCSTTDTHFDTKALQKMMRDLRRQQQQVGVLS